MLVVYMVQLREASCQCGHRARLRQAWRRVWESLRVWGSVRVMIERFFERLRLSSPSERRLIPGWAWKGFIKGNTCVPRSPVRLCESLFGPGFRAFKDSCISGL